jgi:hypothetical protein
MINFGSDLVIKGPIKAFKYRTTFGKYQTSQSISKIDLSNNVCYNLGESLFNNPVFLIYLTLVFMVQMIEAMNNAKAIKILNGIIVSIKIKKLTPIDILGSF